MLGRLMPGIVVAALLWALLLHWEPPRPARAAPAAAAITAADPAVDRKRLPSFDEPGFGKVGGDEETPVAVAADARAGAAPQRFSPAFAPPPFHHADHDGGGRGSESAYASLSQHADADAIDFDDIPSGALPPLIAEAGFVRQSPYSSYSPYSRPVSRGIRVSAAGEIMRAEQEPSLFDTAAYSLSGKKYSLALDYDWSIDTVIGASVDMVEATVKSGHQYDKRTTRMDGFVANASFDTVFLDSWLLNLKGFYGRLENTGEGTLGALDDGGASTSRWTGDTHASELRGFSAGLRVPMLFRGYRVVFDTGVEYKRLKSDPYTYLVEESGASQTTEGPLDSSSLSFPAAVSVEKDFVSRFGLLTARLGGGYSYETSDTSGGVRALHAPSASPIYYQAGGFYSPPPPFAAAPRGMYRFDAGLDFRTTGGWNLSAAYRRDFAAAYSADTFRLELGRSF